MNLWGQRKFIVGEFDCFRIDDSSEFYGNLNASYLRLSRKPTLDDASPVIDCLKRGDYFVTTGEVHMLNMIESLRRMPKPNRAAHGGKGSFRFCLDRDVTFGGATWIFQPIWRTAADSVGDRRVPLLPPPLI